MREPLPLKGLAGNSAAGNGKEKLGDNLKFQPCAWSAPPVMKRGRVGVDGPNATRSTASFVNCAIHNEVSPISLAKLGRSYKHAVP